MVTQLTNPQPVQNAVRVETTQILNQVAPVVSIGDIVSLTVRQNSQNGQGYIYFRGNLMQATLPENVQNGQRLLAQVSQAQDAIIFKILDVLQPKPLAGSAQALPIATEFQSLIRQVAAGNNFRQEPLALLENLASAGIPKETIEQLVSGFAKFEELANPERTLQLLQSSGSAAQLNELKQTVTVLKEILQKSTPLPFERTLQLIQTQLAEILLTTSRADFSLPTAQRTLEVLSESILRELKSKDRFTTSERTFLQNIATNLRTAHASPEALRATLETALQAVNQSGAQLANAERLGPDQLNRLQQVITRFEQLLSTQESLLQLNPVLQAIGEPALILFPFLFHGLMSQSEVSVQSKKQRSDDNKQKNSGDQEPFHRVQVTVPLPSLGTVGVDVAHRKKEILVRLTVAEQEVGNFLLEQLEHLAALLREQGFEKAELVAHVGSPMITSNTWSKELQASLSFVA